MTYHYCYRITNIPESKHYYGSRSSIDAPCDDLGKCYFSSSKYLRNDISRLGVSAFRFKIIRIFASRQEAFAFEERCQRRLNVVERADFYNRAITTSCRTGFSTYGLSCSEATRKKISERTKGREISTEVRKQLSDVFKKRMKEMTPEERSRKYGSFGQSNPFWGKTHSPDVIEHIRQSSHEHNLGEKNPFYGKRHTDDTRKYLSEYTKRRIAEKGHPRAGKVWHRVECSTCGKIIAYPMYKRWHDNGKCKDRQYQADFDTAGI